MEVGSVNPAGFLWRLALPTFALALAMSVLTTYAPLLLGEATSSASAIGLAIGAEGLFALFLPLLVGSLSDRTSTRLPRARSYTRLRPAGHGSWRASGRRSVRAVGRRRFPWR